MWNLEDGILAARYYEKWFSEQGFHCALGGSVMYKGSSEKDLDLIVFPHDTRKNVSVEELWKKMLARFPAEASGKCGGSGQQNKYRDNKKVYWAIIKGRRVDFFFLS